MSNDLDHFPRDDADVVGERSFPSHSCSPGAARHFVVGALRRRGCDENLVHAAALAVTELSTNAVVHARSPFTVTLSAVSAGLRIAVRDADPSTPLAPRPDPADESGRGLCLVEGVARRWGVEPAIRGKVVWVELGE